MLFLRWWIRESLVLLIFVMLALGVRSCGKAKVRVGEVGREGEGEEVGGDGDGGGVARLDFD
jgi:hypothetical protein